MNTQAIPLHLIPEALRPQQALAFEFGSPIAGPVEGEALQRFAALMAAADIPLQPTRMLYDRLYACERLSRGYGSGNAALSELSARLFADYQQAGEWIGLMATH